MRVIHYSQHVLGVGHLFRTLEIDRSLAARGHDVRLITGGPSLKFDLPPGVTHEPLPGLRMDENFKDLFPEDPEADVEEVKDGRRRRMSELLSDDADVFLVELFPFGRKRFRFELLPVLEGLRNRSGRRPLAVSGIRDILVEKPDQAAFEERSLRLLHDWFDALLVHADPRLVPLSATFDRVDDIAVPLFYTGYVAPRPAPDARRRLREDRGLDESESLIVAGIGGGAVGGELLAGVVAASKILSDATPHRLLVFGGPYLPQADYDALAQAVHDAPWMRLERFSSAYADLLAAADLSVSMAGYNTTMNVLAAQVPALMLPFAQNREQRLRLELLQDRTDAATMLTPADLQPRRLASLMAETLASPKSTADIDLNGADRTAALLEQLTTKEQK